MSFRSVLNPVKTHQTDPVDATVEEHWSQKDQIPRTSLRRCCQLGGHQFRSPGRGCPKGWRAEMILWVKPNNFQLALGLLLWHQSYLFVLMTCWTLGEVCVLLGLPIMLSAHPGALPGTSTCRVSGCLVPVRSICYLFLSRGFLSRCHFSHSSGNIYQTTELKCQLDFGSCFHSEKIYKDNWRTGNLSAWMTAMWRSLALLLAPADK